MPHHPINGKSHGAFLPLCWRPHARTVEFRYEELVITANLPEKSNEAQARFPEEGRRRPIRRGCPFAVIPRDAGVVLSPSFRGTPGLSFRRHSGEGRNPEPGRAAANGRSRPIHARVHGFVGAVREPLVFLTAWADNPAIVRSVDGAGRSRTTPTGWLRGGGRETRRRTTTGGCPYDRRHRRSATGRIYAAPYGREAASVSIHASRPSIGGDARRGVLRPVRGSMFSQGRRLPGASPRFGNRPF